MHRFNPGSIRVLLMVTLTSLTAVAQSTPKPSPKASAENPGRMLPTPAASVAVGPPARQVSVSPEGMATTRTRPVAANGYLIATSREFTSDQQDKPDRLALTSLRTGRTDTLPFFIKGAKQIRLESSTVNKAQKIVMAGRYDDHNFIALVGQGGTVSRLIDTGAYGAVRVCTAADDSIWTLGQNSDTQTAKTDYSMLQHRSPTGELLGQYLSYSSLSAKTPMNYHAKTADANAAYLACGPTSVVAYVGTGSFAYVWFEVDTITGTVYRNLVPRIPNTIMTGLYVTGLNRAYMSTPTGLYRLITMDVKGLSSPISSWAPVLSSKGSLVKDAILGEDSGAAVHVPNLPITKAVPAAADPQAPSTVYATVLP